jgi:putative toxin-antitoxin system antitoxin component (TIGR02293 family)
MTKIPTASQRPKRAQSPRRFDGVGGLHPAAGLQDGDRATASSWLGGKKFWIANPTNSGDVGSVLARGGLSYGAVEFLVSQLRTLTREEVAKAIGVSSRTLRRRRETPRMRMPMALATRTWKFAEMLATASQIFGGKEQAARWVSKPAIGLDGRRPIDLQPAEEAELVIDFLGRLEHNVYC